MVMIMINWRRMTLENSDDNDNDDDNLETLNQLRSSGRRVAADSTSKSSEDVDRDDH